MPRFPRKLFLFVGLGLTTLVFYLYYFVGTADIVGVLERTNLSIYSMAFVAFNVGVFFSSLAWNSLLRNLDVKMKFKRVFFFVWVGLFFDSTVPEPGWSGDLSKAYMLAKTTHEDTGKLVASVVSQKIIVMSITVFGLILGLTFLARTYLISQTSLLFTVAVLSLTVGSLLVVWYVSTRPRATKVILGWLIGAVAFLRRGRWNPAKFEARAEAFLTEFHQGISSVSAQRRNLWKPALLSLGGWIVDISVVFLTFLSLGYPIPVDKVLVIYALTGALQTMGISFVGFTEVVVSGAYVALGIPPVISISVTLLTRVVTLWFKLVVSYAAFQWAGLRILVQTWRRS